MVNETSKGKISVVCLVCGFVMMLFAALMEYYTKTPIYAILVLPGIITMIVGLVFLPYFLAPETVVVKEE